MRVLVHIEGDANMLLGSAIRRQASKIVTDGKVTERSHLPSLRAHPVTTAPGAGPAGGSVGVLGRQGELLAGVHIGAAELV
ncbi:hypothetical protein GCM10027057_30080 [Marisediminicola antarctica]